MLRVGIVGCGNIAKTLADTMAAMPEEIRIEAVASRTQEKADEFASHYGAKAYGSYEALYEDENVDLVYVAVPHSHHHQVMMDALALQSTRRLRSAIAAGTPRASSAEAAPARSTAQEAPQQTFIFNQPVQTPDEFARAVRIQETYGLAGAR